MDVLDISAQHFLPGVHVVRLFRDVRANFEFATDLKAFELNHVAGALVVGMKSLARDKSIAFLATAELDASAIIDFKQPVDSELLECFGQLPCVLVEWPKCVMSQSFH